MLTGERAELSTGGTSDAAVVVAPRKTRGAARAEDAALRPVLLALAAGGGATLAGGLLANALAAGDGLDPVRLLVASATAAALAQAMVSQSRCSEPAAGWPGPASADAACAAALACALVGVALRLAHVGAGALSWGWIGLWAGAAAVLAVLVTAVRHRWRRARAQAVGLPVPVVLMGSGWSGLPAGVTLTATGDGRFADGADLAAERLGALLPVHRRYGGRVMRVADLPILLLWIERGFVTDVCLAPGGGESRAEEAALLRALEPMPVAVHRVNLRRDPSAGAVVGEVVTLHPLPLGTVQQFVKRCVDLLGAGILLLAFGPLMLLTALAIRLETPGPALFIQERRGFMNRTFPVMKFRSMYRDRLDATGNALTRRNDSRVTNVGALIRRASIDELPQLVNVLRGEMSLVGPRPHPLGAKAGQRLYDQVADRYFYRYRMRPGLTGLAQIRGWRGTTETELQLLRRVENDAAYVDRWSLFLDLVILLKTPFSCLTSRNAY